MLLFTYRVCCCWFRRGYYYRLVSGYLRMMLFRLFRHRYWRGRRLWRCCLRNQYMQPSTRSGRTYNGRRSPSQPSTRFNLRLDVHVGYKTGTCDQNIRPEVHWKPCIVDDNVIVVTATWPAGHVGVLSNWSGIDFPPGKGNE